MSDRTQSVDVDENQIDAVFAELDQCHLPGAAVGIAVMGKPVYRKGFGVASIELPVALSPTIRMRIGSVSKNFTALAYMLLCEDGEAGLDDPIKKYQPAFHPVAHLITMRQLMGHTGGLLDSCDIKFRFSGYGGQLASAEDLLALYLQAGDVNAAPGTQWIYNNGGYVILSAVIEQIAGEPLEAVLQKRIFQPVGMNDTRLRRWDATLVPNSAVPHTLNRAGEYERAEYGLDFAGAGAVVSTVDDMLRWLAHMDNPVVGNATTWATMKTQHTLANGKATGYGLGLMMGQYRGVETVSHLGGWTGGNSQMLKVPSLGLDVIVIVNRSDAFAPLLANGILDACISGLEPAIENSNGGLISRSFVPVRTITARAVGERDSEANCEAICTGVFQSRETGRVVQLFGMSEQQIVSIDAHDLPYARNGDGMLSPTPSWSYIKRWIKPLGNPRSPTAIELVDFGTVERLETIDPADVADPGEILGNYRSDVICAEAEIYHANPGLGLRMRGQFGLIEYSLTCLGRHLWRADSPVSVFFAAILWFNEQTGFSLSTYNTRGVSFRRFARR